MEGVGGQGRIDFEGEDPDRHRVSPSLAAIDLDEAVAIEAEPHLGHGRGGVARLEDEDRAGALALEPDGVELRQRLDVRPEHRERRPGGRLSGRGIDLQAREIRVVEPSLPGLDRKHGLDRAGLRTDGHPEALAVEEDLAATRPRAAQYLEDLRLLELDAEGADVPQASRPAGEVLPDGVFLGGRGRREECDEKGGGDGLHFVVIPRAPDLLILRGAREFGKGPPGAPIPQSRLGPSWS